MIPGSLNRCFQSPAAFAATVLAAILLSPSAISANSLDDALNCTGEWAGSALCLERKTATEQKSKIEALLADLSGIPNPPWNTTSINDLRLQYEEGLNLFREEFYGDASQRFAPVLDDLLLLQKNLNDAMSSLLQAGLGAIDNEDYKSAFDSLARVTKWPNAPSSANEALELARIGVETQEFVEQAKTAASRRDIALAEQVLSQVPATVWTSSVSAIRQEIAGFKNEEAFNAAMTKGYQYSEQGKWSEALSAFKKARNINPEATSAQDAVRETERALSKSINDALQSDATRFQKEEDWANAQTVLYQLTQRVPNNDAFKSALETANRNATAEERVDGYLDDPSRLTRTSEREAATKLAQSIDATYGQRIAQKAARLNEAIVLYSTRSRVTILSDGSTTIRFVPGQNFGRFSKKTFSVVPGHYRVVGTRLGYREVVVRFVVKPKDPPREIRIVCDDTF